MASGLISAAMRAVLVALLIATPALLLPGQVGEAANVILLVALIAATLTFFEYYTEYPCLLEFRDAPPFNRIRFMHLFGVVFLSAVICRGAAEPTLVTRALMSLGLVLGRLLDFPFSPVRLLMIAVESGATRPMMNAALGAAGLAVAVSAITLLGFAALVRLFDWPVRSGAFNVWVNLPLFDPTAGGDVLTRLKRDARLNVALGCLMPFLVPALTKAAADIAGGVRLSDPQTLIWMMSVWAFLPTSMIMRGMALSRVAEMVEEKRRRTAQSEGLQPV